MSLDFSYLMGENHQPISQTQDAHINKFNELGKVMASLADYYDAGKSGDEALITNLRNDFSESWIVGSDRIVYNSESLDAKITRYFDSKFVKPVEVPVFIPDYSSGPTLDDVLATTQGLNYVQALFNTNDDAKTIKKTLSDLSGKPSGNTRVWTPDQASRKNNPNRAAFLVYINDDFRIDGYLLGNIGRSRGVSLSPAGTAPKNSSAQAKKSELVLPFDLNEGIDKKSGCTYFTNHQRIGDYSKYAGLFCFYNNRFLLSMSVPRLLEPESIDNEVSSVLAQDLPTSEKLGLLEKEYRPMYAHLQRYERQEGKGFVCADDSESFGEPRIREVKK